MKLESDRRRMRMRVGWPSRPARLPVLMLAWLNLILACSVRPAIPPEIDAAGEDVSRTLIESHLAVFQNLSPREVDSKRDHHAREYAERVFSAVGASLVPREEGDPHLIAFLPGESEKAILLLVGSRGDGDLASADAGTALVLELARVFGARSRPFSLYFARLGTAAEPEDCELACVRTRDDSPARKVSGNSTCVVGAQSEPLLATRRSRCRLISGGASLATTLVREAGVESFRASVAYVLSPDAELKLGRDLRSHPVYRDLFWETAKNVGVTSTFPADSGWRTAEIFHASYDRFAPGHLLVLAANGPASPTNPLDSSAEDPPSGEAIEAIARVSVAALEELMERFSKVDQFRAPQSAGP